MAQLPSIDELRNANEANLAAPAGELVPLFQRMSAIASSELFAELSTLTWLLGGGWLLSVVALICGIVHALAGDGEPVFRFVVAMIAGTIYGAVKVIRERVRFVDKHSGQDVTITVPLSIGFGVGLLGFGLEALLSLIPIPSIISAIVVFALLFAVWFRRRPPGRKLVEHVLHMGFSYALVRMARPDAPTSISWRGNAYSAQSTLPNGARVTCTYDVGPRGPWFELTVEHVQPLPWRYPQERLVVDFVGLEHHPAPNGPRVRATSTAPDATTTKHLVDALSIATAACR